jgi:hypothetical protein
MVYKISQVIGCAYTYNVSRAVRDAFSQDRVDHSSHKGKDAFSYFRKVDAVENIAKDGGELKLRSHPETGESVDHWYEPELAIFLGKNHQIVGYTLGNDLTAAKIEFEKSREDYDPTYFAKVWKGSCSLGEFIPAEKVGEDDNIDIGIGIKRGGEVYTATYSTSKRKKSFSDLPKMILEYRRELLQKYGGRLPESKRIQLDGKGYLPAGTIIMTGTGIITPSKWYAQKGDEVIIKSPKLGMLKNKIC